ncbi:hypothetical protein DH2020_004288 [Rehmannia glutinosa]|uniref:Protein kinase domain-containing protein n=1 Tax=Rehmannia glutinosa TaxID=99300 RepID=A0ABR0XP13_REHGL
MTPPLSDSFETALPLPAPLISLFDPPRLTTILSTSPISSHADASRIANNNIFDVDFLPNDTLVIVPVNCSFSQNNYPYNATYILQHQGETYFNVANNTYQALTTCESMIAQNPYNYRRLYPKMMLIVPLCCACPTPIQITAGFKYLLIYLICQGNSFDYITGAFAGAGSNIKRILDANRLTIDHLIFFFTPILSSASNSGNWIFISEGVRAAILVLFSSIFILRFFCYRRHKKSPLPPPKLAGECGERRRYHCPPSSLSCEVIQSEIETLMVYKFEELEKVTRTFSESNRIDGSSVCRGSFKGDDAMVKIMKGDVSREIDVPRQINHSHIIRLSSFCLHQGITYLVYEYAEKGSLTEWLRTGDGIIKNKKSDHDKYSNPLISERRLYWKQRL